MKEMAYVGCSRGFGVAEVLVNGWEFGGQHHPVQHYLGCYSNFFILLLASSLSTHQIQVLYSN